MRLKAFLLFFFFLNVAGGFTCTAQIPDSVLRAQVKAVGDSSKPKRIALADTGTKPAPAPHSPKIALRRSAMVPGWGQAYNKQYWKIPVVYGALGITTGVFIYNLKWYKKTRFAFNARSTNNAADIAKIDPKLQDLNTTDLSFYRRSFRQGTDYAVLFFMLAWGLNVVDAVVFAHLKDFDVSDNLGLHLKPGYNGAAGTNGITLALDLNKKKPVKLVTVTGR
jgi:hypothetical protein